MMESSDEFDEGQSENLDDINPIRSV